MSDHNHQINDTKSRILNIAIERFADKGHDAVGIREIAAQSSVSLNTVMYHFTSKENLYHQAIIHILTQSFDFREIFKPYLESNLTIHNISNALLDITKSITHSLTTLPHITHIDLIGRAIYSKDIAVQKIISEHATPANDHLTALLTPHIDINDHSTIEYFIGLFWSQLILHISARGLANLKFNFPIDATPPAEYYDNAASQITLLITRYFKLPDPDITLHTY
ncbi:putative DNA-binding transcriptional regulator [Poriferisphaera corsica]|uniref:Putative DNA-binding transcriptional regulator n=1 Tax=Poriferisphaera corsica TaxID=2528020 RepID=A0A517YY19_9BACT|nr:TetR/AcrR family transcriptional regulator [Poriferisphaera corsica]QDU35121.1 putative DNA-binding transcriptional regulator [Poriferisphaera corsica]